MKGSAAKERLELILLTAMNENSSQSVTAYSTTLDHLLIGPSEDCYLRKRSASPYFERQQQEGISSKRESGKCVHRCRLLVSLLLFRAVPQYRMSFDIHGDGSKIDSFAETASHATFFMHFPTRPHL